MSLWSSKVRTVGLGASAVICLISYSVVMDFLGAGAFGQKGLLLLTVGFFLYWTISIFIFLFKRSQYSSATTVIQRYWKRALYLFWALELFLFSIYIYLVLVAPTEVEWLLDQAVLFKSAEWGAGAFFGKFLHLLTLLLLLSLASYALFYGMRVVVSVLFLGAVYLVFEVLLSDGGQAVITTTQLAEVSWEFSEEGVWALEPGMSKYRTVQHYFYLLTVLRFWHTAFIAAFLLISVGAYLHMPVVGQGLVSANLQNGFFLFGFGGLWACLLYKGWVGTAYEAVYGWFLVNARGVSGTAAWADVVWCWL